MEKYMNEARLLRDLNRSLDGDYQKLSDKYHDLQLSHNRKKKALEKIFKYFKTLTWPCYLDVVFVIAVCEQALFCDGRERSRPLVKRKSKGGAK